MSEKIYPKERTRPPVKAYLRYRVEFDLIYDGGGSRWTSYYGSWLRARLAAWWNYHISSWGGSVVIVDQKKEYFITEAARRAEREFRDHYRRERKARRRG